MSLIIDGTNGLTFPDTSNIISHNPSTITAYISGSGTYTTPTNAKYLIVQMVGGGGGGGTGGSGIGGGGGAGGYLIGVISSPAATYSYAVGAAGTGGSSNGGT